MADLTKILELYGDDWIKGVSAHAGLPVGGIFQTATEFDPFNLPGFYRASLSPTTVDNTTLSTQINAMAAGASGSDGYVFAIGNRSGAGAKCLYRIKTSDNTVTDYQASADASLLLGGIAIWGGYVIYGDGNDAVIHSAAFPGMSGTTAIEIPGSVSVADQPIVFRVGPSGYLHYFAGVANGKVGVITVPSSNHANNIDNSVIVQTDLTPKDGCTDGRYFIVIADNNPSRATGINADCKVFFTVPAFSAGVPSSTSTWELSYAIPDQYLISARFVNGVVRILGYSGIWECGIGMPPRLVMPLLSTQLPTNPYMVDVQKDVLVWGSNSTGGQIWAYGNPLGGKPVLFNPYDSTSGTQLNVALVSAGNYLYAGTDATGGTTRVVAHNYGATRANSTIQTVIQHLPNPYKFGFIKVTLKKPLASGETVSLAMYNGNDEVIMDTNSKSFTTFAALRTFKFEAKPGSTPISEFDNFYLQINPQGGAIIDRVAVYGVPVTDISQTK